MRRPRLLLVTGPPGTGKSTVADAVSGRVGAAVLAHDWAMSGLRPYRALQAALDAMDPPGQRPVGWSVLFALARSELRRGRPVVLDGVARRSEAEAAHALAAEEGEEAAVIVTGCSDAALHRSRVEGRDRGIPGWDELEWSHVQGSLRSWESPPHDLLLDAADRWEDNERRLAEFLGRLGW